MNIYRRTGNSSKMHCSSANASPGTASYIVAFLAALILSFAIMWWQKLRKHTENVDKKRNLRKYRDLRLLRHQHETAAILSDLVDKDGAGAWPPKANHDSWPAALKPYKDIYLECIPFLLIRDPSTNDDLNRKRVDRYRSGMRKLMQERINVSEVARIMKTVEAGYWNVCPRECYNAVYCCIAVCRHAYR